MADWSENEANFSLRQAHEVKEVPPYVFDSEVPSEKKHRFSTWSTPPFAENVFKKTFAQFPAATGFLFLIITE